MPKNEIDNYKLTSMEEPTDEMLGQIMKEVSLEVKQKEEVATKQHYIRLQQEVKKAKEYLLLL